MTTNEKPPTSYRNPGSPSDLAAQFRAEMEKGDPPTEAAQLLLEHLARGDDEALSNIAEIGHEDFMQVMEVLGHALTTDCPLCGLGLDDLPRLGLPSDDLVVMEFVEIGVIPLPPPPGFGRG